MRMRSTGLGKTELVGDFNDIKQVGDFLVIQIKTTEPVKWQVRTAINITDVAKIIKLLLRPSTLLFLGTHIFKKPQQKPSSDY